MRAFRRARPPVAAKAASCESSESSQAEAPPTANDKMGIKQVMKRRIATAAMDEVQTAIYKATTDDKLLPKEKHVVTL
eukprot:131767-Prymnesium_polylepis.1